MKIQILITLVSLSCFLTLNAQTFEWAKAMGGNDADIGYSVIADEFGNVYNTGVFSGTADFDPGSGTTFLTSNGSADVYVQKLDALGNLIWVRSFGSVSGDYGASITIDNLGNIYTTGFYQGTTDFDPGAGVYNLSPVGATDAFVQKLDPSGNFVWVKTFGGISSDYGISIKTDDSGNVYITGFYRDTVDFDPGIGTYNLTSAGGWDIFIQKLDAFGNFLWTKSIGGTEDDTGRSITIDHLGNIYTTGRFGGIVDFDPGIGVFNLTSNGGPDVFIQKIDNNGNFIWARSFGGTGTDVGRSIDIDSLGNTYITGAFNSTVDFDPGIGIVNLTSNGGSDAFIEKIDNNGNFIWARSFGGSVNDVGISTTTDTLENVYISGTFQNTVDFDPGTSVLNKTSVGGVDRYISKLDNTGDLIWAKSFGNTGNDRGGSIYLDYNFNIYTTGFFENTVDFDHSAAVSNLTSAGNIDIFIHKISQCSNTTGTDIQTACDTYTWIDGNTYTASNNTATHTLTNVAGCDSVVTLDLTILNSTTGTDIQTACDTYTWIDGNTYTSSNNTATHTLTNAAGCDSVVTLDLTILNSTTGTDIQTACDTYTWIDGNTYTSSNNTATHTLTNAAGCDSVVILDLTILNSTTGTDVQTACDTYTWIDGNTYTASNNTATHTLTNAAGCDSVVTLDLTINNSNTGTDIQTACDSYTWIDGNTYTSSNNTATHTLTNAAGCDSVVTLDLTINNSNTGTDIQTACDSYTWIDGNTYTASNNTATHTLTNSAGCDSVVTLDLTINNSNTGTDIQTACDTYTWIDGNTYTASNNTATHTLTNAAGCDSVVTLDLTINNSNTGTDIQTACDTYTWIDGNTYTASNNTATHTLINAAGCDSVVTLDLTILNSTTGTDIQTACDTYTWIDGNTYTSSNNSATWTLTNASGCDSVITLDLSISNVSDITTDVSGITISANNSNATYSWLDCSNNYAVINGETNASFTPTTNGNYAVELTENGCTDTSACVAITTVGIIENTFNDKFKLYPNPTDGLFSVKFKSPFENITLKILDVSGMFIDSKTYYQVDLIEYELNEPKGVYLIEVSDGKGQRSLIRLIKQ